MNVDLPEHIDGPIKAKLQKVIGTVTKNLPETPEVVFISTIAMSGELSYLSVWLFTPRL